MLHRAEYDHPSVVSKNRRQNAVTMQDQFRDYNDMEQVKADKNLNNLWSPSQYRRESRMFRMSAELQPMPNLSPD